MIRESEQPRQIRSQTSIRTAKTFVCIETLERFGVDGSLVQELIPFLKPSRQSGDEIFLSVFASVSAIMRNSCAACVLGLRVRYLVTIAIW